MDWFVNCSLQIGDRQFYHIKNDDVIGTTDPTKVFNPQSTIIKSLGLQIGQESLDEQKLADAVSTNCYNVNS